MTAWDAITVAAVASRTMASRPQDGTSRKNGLARHPEDAARIRAP